MIQWVCWKVFWFTSEDMQNCSSFNRLVMKYYTCGQKWGRSQNQSVNVFNNYIRCIHFSLSIMFCISWPSPDHHLTIYFMNSLIVQICTGSLLWTFETMLYHAGWCHRCTASKEFQARHSKWLSHMSLLTRSFVTNKFVISLILNSLWW